MYGSKESTSPPLAPLPPLCPSHLMGVAFPRACPISGHARLDSVATHRAWPRKPRPLTSHARRPPRPAPPPARAGGRALSRSAQRHGGAPRRPDPGPRSAFTPFGSSGRFAASPLLPRPGIRPLPRFGAFRPGSPHPRRRLRFGRRGNDDGGTGGRRPGSGGSSQLGGLGIGRPRSGRHGGGPRQSAAAGLREGAVVPGGHQAARQGDQGEVGGCRGVGI